MTTLDDILAKDEADWLRDKAGWHVILTKSLIGWQWTAYKDGWPRRWGWRLFSWNAEYAGKQAASSHDRDTLVKKARLKWSKNIKV